MCSKKGVWLGVLMLHLHALSAIFAGETEDTVQNMPKRSPLLNGVITAAEVVAFDTMLYLIDHYVLGFWWAEQTFDSVRKNLTESWVWERNDGFMVNQFGHPYQGSYFFTAARSNGFNFYHSLFFTAFGSAAWEVFYEIQSASINDTITTSISSASVGEMLHRLYVELYSQGAPPLAASFVSPMDGLNHLLGNVPVKEINTYEFSVSSSAGFVSADTAGDIPEAKKFSYRSWIGDLWLNMVYGNPFEQESKVPYKQFDAIFGLGFDHRGYSNMRLVSDGSLVSFPLKYTPYTQASTGLTLHCDIFSNGEAMWYMGHIDCFSNALDWTLKYRHVFSGGVELQLKLHSGWTFWGVSEFYNGTNAGGHRSEYMFYGTGTNAKFFLGMEHAKFGRVTLDLMQYLLFPYSAIIPRSAGTLFWLFANVSYSYPLTKNAYLGIVESFEMEQGNFKRVPDVFKWTGKTGIFFEYKWGVR
ncbi:MAG: DUF3943 domain-containing protein [Treponema sp.]|nr:DUF3943 domain-containing protein [Treponema sp.]